MTTFASQLAAVQKFVLRDSAKPVAGVAGTRTLSSAKRLGIYRDAYFLRLHEVLSSAYAGLKIVLGDPRFDQLIAAYAARHRSHHYSIRHYGDELAGFLAKDARFKREPALAEIAAWEWTMAYAFDAADADPLGMQSLAEMPPQLWGGVTFAMHPSLRIAKMRWNSVALWQAANRGEPPPDLERYTRLATWAVWRRELEVLFEKIGAPEHAALRRALRGGSFAELCARAPNSLADDAKAAWAVQLIQRWVARGWIVALIKGTSLI